MFYKTRILVEIEVENQFEPKSSIEMVKQKLSSPCYTSVTILKVESNFQLHKEPSNEFIKVEF